MFLVHTQYIYKRGYKKKWETNKQQQEYEEIIETNM